MNFHIFTMVWGNKHIDLFRRGCFRSLNWEKNRQALGDSREWVVYTTEDHVDEIIEIFKHSNFSLKIMIIEKVQHVVSLNKLVPLEICDPGLVLLNGLKGNIRYSFENNPQGQSGSRMLFAPPDTIFGDGTVENLIKLGSVPGSCVAVAHPRVNPEILDEIEYMGATRGSFTNAQLVTLAFRYPHKSWELCEVGHSLNRSLIGGVAWKRLSTGLYSVSHRMPTHYFCDFTKADWDFWWGVSSFGAYDHSWPGENMIRQGRQRYVGSSDACFIVEVTDVDKNIPFDVDRSKVLGGVPEDGFILHNKLHTETNRLTNVIYRGE